MKFSIGDKVIFTDVLQEKYAWKPEKNVIYTIQNCAFGMKDCKNYYSLQWKNNSVSWIREEDLCDIKKDRRLKLNRINVNQASSD